MEQRSAGGHDVIECEDCRETITSCSCCVEESLLRLAVKQSQFGKFLLFFSKTCERCTMRHFAEPFHGTILHYAEPFHAKLHHLCVRCTMQHYADPCHETLHWNFITVCNSSLFFLVVLAHTDEQYNNLLNTRESIIMINVRLSNRYFTRLIRQRLPIHFEVTWVTCSSHVRLQYIVTPRFFSDLDDVISLLSSVMLRSPGIFVSICGVPRSRSFVLSGLMSRLFLQHHAAMFRRSSVSWSTHS